MAVVLTRASCRTTVIESNPDRAAALPQRVGENLAQIGREANLPRLAVAASLDQVDWASVDLVIECIPERLDIKQALFADLARRARPDAILASNSSSFPISAIGQGLDTRERMLGLHFFMPAHLVPLVEVVMADTSDEASADALIAFMKRCGSVPVKVRQDLPGFLANRLQHALSREAFDLIDRGIASPEDVDAAVRFGFGFRFLAAGPVMQRDHAGIEVHRRRRHHVPHVLQRGPPRALPGRARRRWPPRHEDRRRLLRLDARDHRRRARALRPAAARRPGPDRARTAGDPAMTHAADPRPQAPRLPLAESPSSSPWRPTAPTSRPPTIPPCR